MLLLKNLLFTLVIPGTVAVTVPLLLKHGSPQDGLLGFLALVPLGLGLMGYVWCLLDFALRGRGTPFPADPPRCLVIRGLYRFSRNPMYLSVLSLIAGWAWLFQSGRLVFYGLAIALMFHCMVVFYEEPHLRQRFGADYEKYCNKVPRWL